MWLVVGGDSEIGAMLCRRLESRGYPVTATTRRRELVGPRRPYLDLAAPLESWKPPDALRAACIVAGVARLAACAADPVASAAVNVTGTLALAERLIARRVHVLFLSSNQVFDGTISCVAADSPTCPVSEYGRQKASVESALKEHIERHEPVAILRLAKVLSPTVPLLTGWVDALAKGRRVRAFHDMKMAPTPIEIATDAILTLMREEARGIFQLTGPRDVSYADVARYLAGRIRADPALVEATSVATTPMPAGGAPLHTTLDSSTLRTMYEVSVSDVWEIVDTFVSAAMRENANPQITGPGGVATCGPT